MLLPKKVLEFHGLKENDTVNFEYDSAKESFVFKKAITAQGGIGNV